MSKPVVRCEACGREKWSGRYGDICMGTGTRNCQEAELARLRKSAPTIAARLEEAVGLLRRAREHIADTSPPAGNCLEPCGHRYCAVIRAASAGRDAIVAAADALLAAVDAEKAREGT